LKPVIAEDTPQLPAFDENKSTERLHYELQSAQDAVALLALNRRCMTAVLRVLPEEAFKRTGIHSERGEMSLETLLNGAISHLDHHLKFLYEKREKLGKMMW